MSFSTNALVKNALKLFLVAALAAPAMAVPLTGQLLIQHQLPGAAEYRVTEYLLDGTLIQTLTPQFPPSSTEWWHPRDLVVGQDGRISLINGTLTPYLSTYNPISGFWSHLDHPGWLIGMNESYGGIARFGDTVFVTNLGQGGSSGGVIAFNLATGISVEFGEGLSPTDLNLGLDGKLWALDANVAYAFDPATYEPLRTVNLDGGFDVRGLAVDRNGNFFLATWDGLVANLSPDGSVIQSLSFFPSQLFDVDISPGGLVLVGSRLHGAFLTDTSLSLKPAQFAADRWNSFVTFVPEPTTLSALAIFSVLVFRRARR